MSDLLITWLNDQLQLSKRVTNFEQDFRNGYLFGQLLAKYNQQLNFSSFINKQDKNSRMNNFALLYQTFNALRVTFNSNTAQQIFNKKPGIAKKVLYQLKMQLQKTNQNAFNKITKPHKTLSPLKKIQASKDKFDSVNKQHFKKQINTAHRAQKAIIQQRVLKKFSDFQVKQQQINQVQQQKQVYAKLMNRARFRQRQRQNLKKSTQFRAQWQQSNVQKWAENRAIRKNQQSKDLFYKTSLQQTIFKNMLSAQQNAVRALDNDISNFQKKFGKKDDSSDEQAKEPKQGTTFQKNPSKLSAKLGGSTSFINKGQSTDILGKKKRNILGEQNSRHQRQKRRRKMIVQQNKRHQLIEINRRQRCIIATIQQTSKQQKELEYQIWRAWQNKQIITHNKKLHDQKQKEKQQTRAINNKFKDDQLLKTYRAQHADQLKNACQRQDKLYSDHKVLQRKNIYNECRKIIDQFINITEKCYEFQQEQNKEELQQAFLNHILAEFVADAKTKQQIADIQLTNYIKGKGDWKIQVKKQNQEISTDPIVENALPDKPVNNVYLGNILKTIFTKIYPQNNNRASSDSSHLNDKFCASLLGLEFSGKKAISKDLKEKFGVNIILIDELISKKLEDYTIMNQKGIQVSNQTEQLVEKCYQGKDIPNRLIIHLLEQQLKKNPKSVIVDYPITYEQATDLTKSLSQIEPQDIIQPSKLEKKIKEFSRLAQPTSSVIVPLSTKSCGIDFALWIDISSQTSLDRFLGRRWIDQNVYHVDKQIENVNSLKVGQKASSTILKNNFKAVNKPQIENWFSNFGTEIKQKQNKQNQAQTKILNTWKIVSGQCFQQQLKDKIFNAFEQALKLKQNKKTIDQQKKKEQQEEEKKKELIKIEKQQLKAKCAFSTGEQLKDELKIAQNSVDFDKQFLESLSNTWNTIEKNTINCLLQSFKRIRSQQQQNRSYIASVKRTYIRLLTREDEKFYLVKEFQNKYNKFFDNQNDMVGYQYTKEQLHQRVQDLEDDLLNIIQTKKEQAIQQRINVMNSGWLQSQLEKFYLAIFVIVQAQLQRSTVSQQLIADFYSKKWMVQQPPAQQIPSQINVDNTLQLFKEDASPRLQKLIQQALRIFNREEEQIEDKNKKGGKGAKKQDKKAAKKGKEQPQQKGQPTPQQLQMKKAVNTQKSIFRYRINILKQYALRRIKQIYSNAQKLYLNLEDLYLYTNKVQNNSIFNMSKIFRKAIEKEQKIQNQVQIDYVQVTETQLIKNFQKPKPIISPAKQQSKPDRFIIANLNQFIQLITTQSQGSEKISTKRLLTLFSKFMNNQLIKNLLPSTWFTLKIKNYENLIKLLDQKKDGYVNLWKIFVFGIMTNFSLPTEQNIKNYKLALNNFNDTIPEVEKEAFIRAKAWFDEQQQQTENTRTFNRKQHIKNILFELFKNKDDRSEYLNIDRYLQAISLSNFNNENIGNCSTYYDFGFALPQLSE